MKHFRGIFCSFFEDNITHFSRIFQLTFRGLPPSKCPPLHLRGALLDATHKFDQYSSQKYGVRKGGLASHAFLYRCLHFASRAPQTRLHGAHRRHTRTRRTTRAIAFTIKLLCSEHYNGVLRKHADPPHNDKRPQTQKRRPHRRRQGIGKRRGGLRFPAKNGCLYSFSAINLPVR